MINNKVSSVFHVRLILLVFLSGSMLVTVKGRICSQEIGPCNTAGDCSSLCAKVHPGSRGSCDPETCKCFYACPTAPLKMKACQTSLGIYTSGCDNAQCDSDCHAKFPGAQDGHGFCYSISPFVSCSCVYFCDD